MTNEQILIKAIERAVDGGWNKGIDKEKLSEVLIDIIFNRGVGSVHGVIFSHGFAKGLWGNKETTWIDENRKECRGKPAYIIHLQRMVIEKEPLKFIEKFL